jgi:CRP-like cAMP-binding protein
MNKELKKLFRQLIKSFSKGQILIYEADEIDRIYYNAEGFIKVYTVVNADVQRIIYIYKPGDIFPLTTYLSGSNIARFFYECMTDAELRIISAKKFEEKIMGNYELGEALVQYTTNIDKQVLRRVNDMVSSADSLSKLNSLLNFLYQKFSADRSQTEIILPMSVKDVASMSGLSREEAVRCLARFKNRGVSYSSTRLVINKPVFRTKT